MFIDRFAKFLRYEKRYSAHTLTAYDHEVNRYIEYLGEAGIDVNAVTNRQARTYLANLLESGQSPVSVNRSLSALRTYYRFLMREGLALQNPFTLIKALKTPKKLPVVVDKEKLSALLDAEGVFADTFEGLRDKVVMELLFGTGIRLAELLQICEGHIDFYNRNVLIFGKRNKERLVPLNQTLGTLLKHYIDVKKKQRFDNISSRLIVTKEGKDAYPKLIYDIVTHYLSAISSQQKRSPHVLRHTFATALLDNGADLNAIKELLGHAGLAATQVYTHNSVERLKSIYKQAHPKA
ncbi:tyrosine-type recombinase/integrase [Parapedobacter sp. ISTM3]|uniref:tyrosine-type recombinase/integrase n=1 Tax=Parapedobacter sp. ISTM3 TaxID=2800130 RepID=UPI00190416FA|nr:tyrosine-type recombinase/integrase [Parapedobacter sp. ISTM3]MBK1440262.1 tyrosine-type recombinase/integrase [Parapedobacter sp. ISTM3]